MTSTRRRKILWLVTLISQAARQESETRLDLVISLSCCGRPAGSRTRCVHRCEELCLKNQTPSCSCIRRPELAEEKEEVCSQQNMLLKTALNVWEYCLMADFFFSLKYKYHWALIAAQFKDHSVFPRPIGHNFMKCSVNRVPEFKIITKPCVGRILKV